MPSKLLVFPDENHVRITCTLAWVESKGMMANKTQWVLKHENSLVWHREVLGWINKYSGVQDEQQLVEQAKELKLE